MAASCLAELTAPNAPRALLVYLADDGTLKHQPVGQNQSVLNIEAELQDHLSAQPYPREWLIALRDYCNDRLAARAEAAELGGFITQKPGGGWKVWEASCCLPCRTDQSQQNHDFKGDL